MKLMFIGTGSAFTVGGKEPNYQSNMILEADSHKKLLIDCGADARRSLYEQGIDPHEISDIYISHLHADHIGGLEWLALTSKYVGKERYKHCLHLHRLLVDDLWDRALSAGLNPAKDPLVTLSTYFDVDIVENDMFEWEGIAIHLFATKHIVEDDWLMPCYGLWFRANKTSVLITADTQLDLSRLQKLYDKSDIIFQDCETSEDKSGVHAHYSELKHLPLAIKNKMWLYHFNPGPLPDAEKDGFKGFIRKGACFKF